MTGVSIVNRRETPRICGREWERGCGVGAWMAWLARQGSDRWDHGQSPCGGDDKGNCRRRVHQFIRTALGVLEHISLEPFCNSPMPDGRRLHTTVFGRWETRIFGTRKLVSSVYGTRKPLDHLVASSTAIVKTLSK